MRLADLIQGLSASIVRGSPQTEITQIVEDSRQARPGCLFIARAWLGGNLRRFA